jgi:hypothetical protein
MRIKKEVVCEDGVTRNAYPRDNTNTSGTWSVAYQLHATKFRLAQTITVSGRIVDGKFYAFGKNAHWIQPEEQK